MTTDEQYVPDEELVIEAWKRYSGAQDAKYARLSDGDAGDEARRFLARVRRDAALHEKQRIAGEVRLWASVNDDLGYTETAEMLTHAANDIDRLPEETP